jgi:hypothetical protein
MSDAATMKHEPVTVPAPWRSSALRWAWLVPLLLTMLVPFV